MKKIEITGEPLHVEDCVSVIIVPENALAEPGYVRTLTVSNEAHAKHEFFAMAQMAYYQYQDGELTIMEVKGPLKIRFGEELEDLDGGMLICRDGQGELHVLVHEGLNKKKMLETANRYCTRWVRLDI